MFIDTHLHLDEPWLVGDGKRKNIIQNIDQNKIITFAQSCDIPSYQKVLEYSNLSQYIFPSFGILPWYAHEYKDRFEEIEGLCEEALMFGEIGLDEKNARDKTCIPFQRPLFNLFLKKAEQKNMILNLHFRGTEQEGFETLKSYNLKKPIFHAYSGSVDLMKDLAEEGYFYSLSQGITRIPSLPTTRRKIVETNIRSFPEDLLLLEIDVIEDERLPSTVFQEILETLAKIKRTTPDDIEQINQQNVLKLVKDDDKLSAIKNLIPK